MYIETKKTGLSVGDLIQAIPEVRKKSGDIFPFTNEVCQCRYCAYCQKGKCSLKQCCCMDDRIKAHNCTISEVLRYCFTTDGLIELLDADVIATYRTSDTVWKELVPTSVKNVTNTNESDKINWQSVTLVFDKTITMRLRFTVSSEYWDTISGYAFTGTFGDDIPFDHAVLESTNGTTKTFYIDIEGFTPTQYENAVTVQLESENGVVASETVTYSVMSYIAGKKNSDAMKTLVRALYDYGVSGKAYKATIE